MRRTTVFNLIGIALIVIIGLIGYLWSASRAYYHIRIDVEPQEVRSSVDGIAMCSMPLSGAIAGAGVGLELRGLSQDEAWLEKTTFPQAWDNVRVTNPDDGTILLEDSFSDGNLDGWKLLEGIPDLADDRLSAPGTIIVTREAPTPARYSVEADLYWGREAGIRILNSSKDDYVAIRLRPFRHGDATIAIIQNGRPTTVAAGKVPASWTSGLAVFAGKILTIFPATCGLVLGAIPVLMVILLGFNIPIVRKSLEASCDRIGWSRVVSLSPYLIAGVSLAISSYIIVVLLEGVPHVQDSVVYLFQARIFAAGKLWTDLPKWQAFFEHQFVVFSDGRLYGQYPFGYPIVLALGVLLNAPWAVNPIFGALSILVAYRLASFLYDRTTALFSVILMVLSPFFLLMNGTFMSHSVGLFYCLSAVYLTVTAHKKSAVARGFGAGLCLSLLMATRFLTSLVIGVIAACIELIKLKEKPRQTVRHALAMSASCALGIGLLLGQNHLLTGSPFQTAYDQYVGDSVAGEELGFSGKHTISNAFRNVNTLTSSLLYALFPLTGFFVAAPMLIPFLRLRPAKTDLFLGCSIIAIISAYFCYMWAGLCYGPRYYFEILPAFTILTARGFFLLIEAALSITDRLRNSKPSSAWNRNYLRAAVIILIVAGMLHDPSQYAIKIKQLRAFNVISTAIIKTVEERGISNAIVFVKADPAWPAWLRYGSVFGHNSIGFDGPVIYARSLGIYADELLMRQYPHRRSYLATYPSGELEEYGPPSRALEPRWSIPADVADETERQLLWITEPCREKCRTALVFTAALAEMGGRINIYINGEYALTLDLAKNQPMRWSNHDYQAAFDPRPYQSGKFLKPNLTSGVFQLTIPAEQVTVGSPVSVRFGVVAGSEAPPLFILYQRPDTLAFERRANENLVMKLQSDCSIEGFQKVFYTFSIDRGPTGDYRSDASTLVNHWWL